MADTNKPASINTPGGLERLLQQQAQYQLISTLQLLVPVIINGHAEMDGLRRSPLLALHANLFDARLAIVSKVMHVLIALVYLLVFLSLMGCGGGGGGGEPDIERPKNLAASLSNGDFSTTSRNITLRISATDNIGVTEYFLNEGPLTSFPPATAQRYTASSLSSFAVDAPYLLSNGYGRKQINIWARDQQGNYEVISIYVVYAAPVNATAISAGREHALFLRTDGTVWSWGQNTWGQLGDGTITDRAIPVQVDGLTNISAIASGGRHNLALAQDGTVWAWGESSCGQLGYARVTTECDPVPSNLGLDSFDDVTVGAVLRSLPVSVTANQVATLNGVIAIAAGAFHSLALKSDGTVWAWGANGVGQLGDNTTTTRAVPSAVSGLSDIVAIAAGANHNLALKRDGTVWAWGFNAVGQLGNGSTTDSSSPIQVTGLSTVRTIGAGEWHSLVVKNDGTVWAWGRNVAGQLGNGTTALAVVSPVQVLGLTNALMAQGGFSSQDVNNYLPAHGHTLVLTSEGIVWSFGNNAHGELGDATTTQKVAPVQTTMLRRIKAIAAGGFFSVALKDDGTIYTWGKRRGGTLGDGLEPSLPITSRSYPDTLVIP